MHYRLKVRRVYEILRKCVGLMSTNCNIFLRVISKVSELCICCKMYLEDYNMKMISCIY